MNKVNQVTEKKEGKKWVECYVCEDRHLVNDHLMHALINKKLCQCTYIRSITRSPHYDGTQIITVYYDNGFRDTFTVEE